MPKYKCEIDYIIRETDFKRIFNQASTYHDKTMITLLWITAGRPVEIRALTKNDIFIDYQKGILVVTIETKKLGKPGSFVVRKRRLKIRVDINRPYIQVIDKHLKRLKDNDTPVINYLKNTFLNKVKKLCYDALGKDLCSYNFRHSRMTILAENGMTEDELMRFKGARTKKSVAPYVHARDIVYDVLIDA